MEIFVYQAECGDAARIRYLGKNKRYYNVFVDAGYNKTFRNLLHKEIRDIENANELIDLWIISHIHDDHIGGILSYIKAVTNGIIPNLVKNWYYNPPRLELIEKNQQKLISISSAKSIRQGDQLTQFLKNADKVPQELIHNESCIMNLSGLKLTVLSPSKNSLNKLFEKYSSPTLIESENRISEAKSLCQNDYHLKIEDFNLDCWEEDDSIENGSSISFLIEADNKKTLWLSDSYPTVVYNKLRKLGYSEDNPLLCDWVKVSHHGSSGNMNDSLLSIIRCNKFLFSTNGENKHCLPNKECIARILRNKYRAMNSCYEIYFTYNNRTLRNIFKSDRIDVYERYNFKVHFNDQRIMKL